MAIAWACFLIPFPGLSLFLGWPLNLVAFVLAIVAMSKGGAKKGLFQLLGSLIASPVVYFIGLAIFAGAVGGLSEQNRAQMEASMAKANNAAQDRVDGAAKANGNEVASAAEAAIAVPSALEVNSAKLFQDYQDNEIAADAKYRDKALLVSGKIESIASDFSNKPIVQLAAGDFGQVHASGLSLDVAADLKKGRKVTLACTGAGEVLGFPMLVKCAVQ